MVPGAAISMDQVPGGARGLLTALLCLSSTLPSAATMEINLDK